jgi:hypothetical protein
VSIAVSPRSRAAILLPLGAAGALLLRWFPPWLYSFYPPCPFRTFLGVRCPGCGTTHALAAMLAGHWTEAWHYNALAVIVWPLLAAAASLEIYSALRWNRWRALFSSPLF